jgi:hypothetical protein
MALTKPQVEMFPSGPLIQRVHNQTGALDTTTTVIPIDDTIPQITEGKELLTVSITPKSATNKLIIECSLWGAIGGANYFSAALFQDATANALCARPIYCDAANVMRNVSFVFEMVAGTTSSTTFRMRGGPGGATTLTVNGQNSTRVFGGVGFSSITVTEVAV